MLSTAPEHGIIENVFHVVPLGIEGRQTDGETTGSR
jgi:hypothetical protein